MSLGGSPFQEENQQRSIIILLPTLLIPTILKASPIHGLGVFAAEDIPKGAMVWEFTEGFDQECFGVEIERLPKPQRRAMLHYAYRKPGTQTYVLCADDTRFFNHAENPTVTSTDVDGPDIAARLIRAGEELTIDYRAFDADWEQKLPSLRSPAA